MTGLLYSLVLIFTPTPALAYLPPAFFLYSKISESRAKTPPVHGVSISISRPQGSGTEETLGTLSLPEWKAQSNGAWPTLSLIFETDQEALLHAITSFGLSVPSEQELSKVEKERLVALKDPPKPFYKVDPNMALKRTRLTYAWVHRNQATGKSIWVEKDTFLPLKISAPCPSQASELGWAKSGENKCELEFRNLHALKRGNLHNTRLTLWKDGVPLLFFTFEKIAAGKAVLPESQESLPEHVKEIAEAILR